MTTGRLSTEVGGAMVSGASADLFRDDDTSVEVTFSAPISELIGLIGSHQHPNFTPTDISLASAAAKIAGIGLNFAVNYSRHENVVEVVLEPSAILGVSFTVSLNSPNPLDWTLTATPFASLSTGGHVGALGMAVGASINLDARNGQLSSAFDSGFVLAGFRAEQTLLSYGALSGASYPDYSEQRLQELAHGRGIESPAHNYLEAQDNDDAQGMARAAMQLPGVYQDAILREAAGYGAASQAEIDRVAQEQQEKEEREARGVFDLEGPEAAQDQGDNQSESENDLDKTGPRPIVLDLDGNGISVTELSQSAHYVDGGDGLKHRTAWAAAGDGVLFFDTSGDGQITEKRDYVFTDWDPSATSDLEALRSVFDTNGDGKLTAADSTFASFKVMPTNAIAPTVSKPLRRRASRRATRKPMPRRPHRPSGFARAAALSRECCTKASIGASVGGFLPVRGAQG